MLYKLVQFVQINIGKKLAGQVPDGKNLPEESEDLESDELDAEEYSEDDE